MGKPAANHLLERSTTLGGAVILGLGAIVGTGAYVSIVLAAGLAGDRLIWAVLAAAVVAGCNGLSSAQLAAVHPVSGGSYEYGYRFLNHWLGFIAGWLFVTAKSASAATAALAIGLYLMPAAGFDEVWLRPLALVIVLLLTLLVLGGLRRSNQANLAILAVSIGALFVFAASSLLVERVPGTAAAPESGSLAVTLEAAALLFVAYTGYGRVATLGEEMRDPERNIPRAVLATLGVTTLLYLLIALAVLRLPLPAAGVSGRELTLVDLAGNETVALIVLTGAVVAMAGVILNLLLGVSRVILAMGRRGDLSARFARLNEDRSAAPAATWLTFAVIASLAMLGDVRAAWSLSAFTVLVYYGITNLAALRVPPAGRFVPKAVSVAGLFGCFGLAWFIEWRYLLLGIGLTAAGLLWHGLRLRAGGLA